MRSLLLALLLTIGTEASAQNIRHAQPGATPPPAQIEQLAWLVGHWEGEGIGGRSYETISPPAAGQMAGHFQQVSEKGVQFYEFYHFVPHEGSLMLRIKHFNSDLTGWEERTETVDFPLVAIEDRAVYFDGITFRQTAPDQMESFVLAGEEGREQVIGFTFRRADD